MQQHFGCGPNMTKLFSGRLLGTCIHLGLCTFSFLTFLVYEGRLICLCRLSRPSFEGWSKHCYCQTTKTKPKFKPSQLPAPLCHLLWAPGSGWAPGLSPGSVDCVHLQTKSPFQKTTSPVKTSLDVEQLKVLEKNVALQEVLKERVLPHQK